MINEPTTLMQLIQFLKGSQTGKTNSWGMLICDDTLLYITLWLQIIDFSVVYGITGCPDPVFSSMLTCSSLKQNFPNEDCKCCPFRLQIR